MRGGDEVRDYLRNCRRTIELERGVDMVLRSLERRPV
jgi:hypothetical protein